MQSNNEEANLPRQTVYSLTSMNNLSAYNIVDTILGTKKLQSRKLPYHYSINYEDMDKMSFY